MIRRQTDRVNEAVELRHSTQKAAGGLSPQYGEQERRPSRQQEPEPAVRTQARMSLKSKGHSDRTSQIITSHVPV